MLSTYLLSWISVFPSTGASDLIREPRGHMAHFRAEKLSRNALHRPVSHMLKLTQQPGIAIEGGIRLVASCEATL